MENTIYITDENGQEREMNILFTFEANEKTYVLVFEKGNEEELYPFTYDDKGNLYAVESEEELEMIEEVMGAFEGNEDEE